jgi:hypothetical protein
MYIFQVTLRPNGDIVFVYIEVQSVLSVAALYDHEPVAGISGRDHRYRGSGSPWDQSDQMYLLWDSPFDHMYISSVGFTRRTNASPVGFTMRSEEFSVGFIMGSMTFRRLT